MGEIRNAKWETFQKKAEEGASIGDKASYSVKGPLTLCLEKIIYCFYDLFGQVNQCWLLLDPHHVMELYDEY